MFVITQGLGGENLVTQGFNAAVARTYNLLHAFLHAGNEQARPVLGSGFKFGSQADLVGTFAQADEKLQMELVGYLDEIDLILVADTAIFDSGNEPQVKDLMTYAGAIYQIKSRKSDQSAYVLGLQKLSK